MAWAQSEPGPASGLVFGQELAWPRSEHAHSDRGILLKDMNMDLQDRVLARVAMQVHESLPVAVWGRAWDRVSNQVMRKTPVHL